MRQAMKANDDVGRRTTRMALAAIKQSEVDKRVPVDEPAAIALLQKEIKNRREAMEEARKARPRRSDRRQRSRDQSAGGVPAEAP